MSENERQWAIEGFIAGIDELKTVLGPEAVGPVECAKEELLRALAHRDGGRCCHRRADQMSATTKSLPTLEVSV